MTSVAENELQTDPIDWGRELVDQLDWQWQASIRPKLEGLTDAEYFWEPVAGAWSIRPRAETASAAPVGDGELVLDFAYPEPSPPPVTTIAWRLGHISVGVLGIRASNHFGDRALSYANAPWPGSADEALACLDQQYAAWITGVRALGPEGLARAVGPAEGSFAKAPYASLILHINREVLHHGAEVLLLRDLYRASGQGRQWIAPAN